MNGGCVRSCSVASRLTAASVEVFRSPLHSLMPVPFRGRMGSTCLEIPESLGIDELLSTCARLDA